MPTLVTTWITKKPCSVSVAQMIFEHKIISDGVFHHQHWYKHTLFTQSTSSWIVMRSRFDHLHPIIHTHLHHSIILIIFIITLFITIITNILISKVGDGLLSGGALGAACHSTATPKPPANQTQSWKISDNIQLPKYPISRSISY